MKKKKDRNGFFKRNEKKIFLFFFFFLILLHSYQILQKKTFSIYKLFPLLLYLLISGIFT